jgi:predicted anti-sigma-YlaC factor YlaD
MAMTCERSTGLMIDVLYGEDVSPRQGLEFFEHIGKCATCRQEYMDLVETREMLAEWEPEETGSGIVQFPQTALPERTLKRGQQWWPLLQKVAATVLIVAGAFSVFQSAGILPSRGTTVSQAQLAEVIHDVTLARQEQDWHVIGTALLELQENLEAKNTLGIRAVYDDMQTLEQRYVHALEESNRHVKALVRQ